MIKQSLPVLALFLGKSSAITFRPSDETNNKNTLAQGGFATGGYGLGKPLNETITVNGPEGQEQHSYAQQRFATGAWGLGKPLGETITVNGPEGQEQHSYAQQK